MKERGARLEGGGRQNRYSERGEWFVHRLERVDHKAPITASFPLVTDVPLNV